MRVWMLVLGLLPAIVAGVDGAGAMDEDTSAHDAAGQAQFAAVIAEIDALVHSRGAGAVDISEAVRGLTPDPEVVALARRQPETVLAAGDYVERLVTTDRIAVGREMLALHAGLLAAIEQRFGVDRHVLVAIWGIESRYGELKGSRPVLRSLATLAAFDERRRAFWHQQLAAAVEIATVGHTPLEQLLGSWAGAMGHTQLMPTTFLEHAVDFDEDGRRDVSTTPADALASAASYLAASGWRSGQPWGIEVRLGAEFDLARIDPTDVAPLSAWLARDVEPATTARWSGDGPPSRLLLPAGIAGPAFLVTANFDAILRFNNAVAYALAVGHLADRLADGAPLVASWPATDVPLSSSERHELQRYLSMLGYDTGGIDGLLGTKSRSAIRQFQLSQGLSPDGHPSRALLAMMRSRPLP